MFYRSKKLVLILISLTSMAGTISCASSSTNNLEKITFTPKEEIVDTINQIFDDIYNRIREVYVKEFERFKQSPDEDLDFIIDLSHAEPNFSQWLRDEFEKYADKLQNLIVEPDEKSKKEFVSKALDILYTGLLLDNTAFTEIGPTFSWCACTPMGERIYTILLTLKDFTSTFSDPNELINYTSLGSGGLWQDLLTVRGLLQAGYKKLNINIIDFNYPEIPLLAKTEKEQKERIEKFQHYDTEISALQIDAFKTELAKIVSLFRPDAEIDVNVFTSPYDLLNQIQKNPQDKSSLLSLIDPGHGIFPEPRYPSQANSLAIVFDQNNILLIFMQLGRSPLVFGKIEQNPPPKIADAIATVKQVLTDLDTTGNYRPRLLNDLINAGILYNPQKIGADAPAIFTQPIPETLTLNEEIAEQGTTVLQNDPYIAFQDLVRETALDNAVIYTLTHPGTEEQHVARPQRFTKANYLLQDVVTPNNGLYYTEVLDFKNMESVWHLEQARLEKNLLNLEVELLSLNMLPIA